MWVCVCSRAHFFNIASIHSWENLMCYWMIFIQIYCIENINSADYDWLMIVFDCLFVCLLMCECACAFMIVNANVHVHTFMLHFLARIHTRMPCAHIFTTISDIDIGYVQKSLFLSSLLLLLFSSPTIRIENKSKGTQQRINCMRCEINECTKVARSSSVSTLSLSVCVCAFMRERARLFNFGIAYVRSAFFAYTQTIVDSVNART